MCDFIEIFGRFRGSSVFRLVHRPPDGSCLPPCYYFGAENFYVFVMKCSLKIKFSIRPCAQSKFIWIFSTFHFDQFTRFHFDDVNICLILKYLTHLCSSCYILQLCFWIREDWTKRFVGNRQKLTPVVSAISWRLEEVLPFPVERLAGSCRT